MQDEPLAAKKRKIAPVPPPNVYAGFSSSDVTQTHHYRPPRTHSTSSIKYGVTAAERLSQKGRSDNDPSSMTGFKYSRPTSKYAGAGNPSRVRKVHHFDSSNGKDALTGDIITTSSWRAGKELVERMLKSQDKEEEQVHKPLKPSPSSSSHLSYRDSLDCDSHSSLLSRSYGSLSDAASHASLSDNEALRPSVDASDRVAAAGHGVDSDSSSEMVSSHDSILESHPRAAQLSSDMTRLLVELQATSRDTKSGASGLAGGPGKEWGGGGGGKGRKVAASSAAQPDAKKPKYNFGECFSADF